MNTVDKHRLWELEVRGFEHPILASTLFELMKGVTGSDVVSQSLLKSYIGHSSAEGKTYAKCGTCGCPVHLVASNAASQAFFRHESNNAPDEQSLNRCSFYSGNISFFGPGDAHKSEGQWHFENKHWLSSVLERSGKYHSIQIEKFIFSKEPDVDQRRKPDIFFVDTKGNKFAIELSRWWMSPQVIAERESFFRAQGINLIWLFSAEAEESNSTTLSVVLYGSPAVQIDTYDDVLSKIECNAFLLSDGAKLLSIEKNDLFLEVLFPVPELNHQSNTIDIKMSRQIHQLSDLALNPSKTLPYAVVTSQKFQSVFQELNRSLRMTKFQYLKELRSLVYEPFIPNSQQDIYSRLKCIEIPNFFDDHYRHLPTVHSYYSIAKSKIKIAEASLAGRIARKEAAEYLARTRARINELFKLAKTPLSSRAIFVAQEQLKSIFALSRQYHSPVVLKRFSSLERKLSDALKDMNAPPISPGYGSSYLVREMRNFIEELEIGFTDLVDDVVKLNLKAARITQWGKNYGYRDEVMRISELLPRAIEIGRQVYWQNEYPNLSKGWTENTLYKEELVKAFHILSQNPLMRDKFYHRINSQKAATSKLLEKFCESLEENVFRMCDTVTQGEPAQTSVVLNKLNKSLVQVIALVRYIKTNFTPKSLDVDRELTLLSFAIELFNEGQGVNELKRKVMAKAETLNT